MSKSKNTQTSHKEFLSLCTPVIQSANSLQEFLHKFGVKSLIFFSTVMLKVIKYHGFTAGTDNDLLRQLDKLRPHDCY